MASHPLLKNLSSEEILEAAERWMALMHVERVVWVTHAGFEGDFYPTTHPDERQLTIAFWTHCEVPGLRLDDRATQEAKKLLTQFADVVRASVECQQNKAFSSDALPSTTSDENENTHVESVKERI